MKILLINPPHKSIGSRLPKEHLPPLGLLSIGGPLIDHGHTVKLLDADVENLPFKHFKDLVKRKGLSAVSKALTNLTVWNKEKNPTLSKKADIMQNKVTAWVEKERKDSGNPDLYEK